MEQREAWQCCSSLKRGRAAEITAKMMSELKQVLCRHYESNQAGVMIKNWSRSTAILVFLLYRKKKKKKNPSHLLHTSWVMDNWFYWCMTQLFCKEVWCKRFFTFHIISSLNLQKLIFFLTLEKLPVETICEHTIDISLLPFTSTSALVCGCFSGHF